MWSKLFKLTRTLFSPLGLGHFLAPLHPRTTPPSLSSLSSCLFFVFFSPFSIPLYPDVPPSSASSSFPRISPVTLSSHCPGAEFEIAPVFDLAPDDLFAFCILLVARIGAIRGAHASYTDDYRAQITRSERQKRSKLRRTTICITIQLRKNRINTVKKRFVLTKYKHEEFLRLSPLTRFVFINKIADARNRINECVG